MDTGGAGLLGQACDELFDLLADDHHQVGQLVDHHDDVGHLLNGLRRVGRQREGIRDRLLALDGIAHLGVEAREVAHAQLAHQPVTPIHFAHTPVQRIGRMAHVGDDGRKQVRDPLVGAHFKHLGVNQDEAGLARMRFVEQRQDHRVDADRFAGARRARHEQVGHLGQIGHDRMTGDVLAERQGHHGMAGMVGLRTEDLGKPDDLAPRIGQLEAHEVLARNGLDHPDADQAQGARQILGKIDDLAALDTRGGLDLIAGNDGTRLCGNHLNLHTEVGQLFLDQPRGELDGFVANRFGGRRRRIQQAKGWQIARIRRLDKKRLLFFLERALGAWHRHHGGFDAYRMLMHDFFVLCLDLFVAHCLGNLAGATILAGAAKVAQPEEDDFQPAAHALGYRQPREAEEQARSDAYKPKQDDRAARKADSLTEEYGPRMTDHPARAAGRVGAARQLHAERRQAVGLKAHGAHQRHEKTDSLLPAHARQDFGLTAGADLVGQPPVAGTHAVQEQDDPPPGRKPEEVEEDIGKIGTNDPAAIVQDRGLRGVRPARIGRVPGQEHQGQPGRQRGEQNPARFAQKRH